MIGGEPEAVVRGSTRSLPRSRRARGCRPGRPGREGRGGTAEQGYLHCGPNGAGHFVKMVHNGIEYGMMAAYAEGLNILKHAAVGKHPEAADAETTPLRDPAAYQYDLDLPDIAEVWRRGSVIASWLLDLTAAALAADPDLDHFRGRVSDSGEGRWTIAGGNRRSGAGHRTCGGALRALQFARRGRLSEPPPLRDARRVRRPCGEECARLIPDRPFP